MRVGEGQKGSSLIAINMKACAVGGMGETILVSDPGPSELRLRREKEKEKRAKLIDGISEKMNERSACESVCLEVYVPQKICPR